MGSGSSSTSINRSTASADSSGFRLDIAQQAPTTQILVSDQLLPLGSVFQIAAGRRDRDRQRSRTPALERDRETGLGDREPVLMRVEPPFYERLPLGRAPLVKHPKLDKSGLASVPPGTYPLTDFNLDVPAAKLRPRRGLEPVQSVGSSDDRESLLGYEAIPDAALAA